VAAERLQNPGTLVKRVAPELGFEDPLGECLVLTGFNVLLALPVIWAALVRRWMLAWIAVAILLAVVLTLAEAVLYEQVTRYRGAGGVFWWINGVHFLWVFCSLGVIRLSGYRLERRTAAQ